MFEKQQKSKLKFHVPSTGGYCPVVLSVHHPTPGTLKTTLSNSEHHTFNSEVDKLNTTQKG